MPDKLFDVSGQVVVITGGTGMLGSVMAAELAERGAQVVVLDRHPDKGKQVVDQITSDGGVAAFHIIDVTDRDSCQAAVDAVMDQFGHVDALVNAAGGNHPQATVTPELSFFDLPPDALDAVMKLNILGTFLPCQVFGAVLAKQEAGSIVNISSMAALKPLTKVVGYSASKAAVTNFTYWLSVYLCQNVSPALRVNAIAPGFFLTDQNRYLLTDRETGDLTPRGQSIIEHTPMGRFGEADDLVGTLVWLLSPSSRFVTGIVVPVDGGFSAFGGI